MTNLRETIAPKSDQLNADDLIGLSKTITVAAVARSSTPDQPIAISFDGDNGKPYKPCKSMRRVLVQAWGEDGNAYVGRSMTLYRDDEVLFGGAKVGGIRISHMTHLERPLVMALTMSKANRKPFTVKPLVLTGSQTEAPDKATEATRGLLKRIQGCTTREGLEALTAEDVVIKQRAWLAKNRPDLATQVDRAVADLLATFDGADVVTGDAA